MKEATQSILFVDDEKGVLSSLRRLLIDEPWNLLFASGGAEGLEIMKEEKVDLVVSDVRMPGMDGISFLKEVKHAYPDTVRIFLSGYADHKSVTRAFAEGCAQQLLPKPWDDEEIKEVIRGALQQAARQKKKLQGLQRIINSLTSLPSMPQTYLKIREALADPENFSVEVLAEVLEQDIAISAELIRWANTALFGQRSKVDTVKRAVVVLGTNIVEGLVLSKSIMATGSEELPEQALFSREDFQKHALATGVIAKLLLAEQAQRELSDLADRAFTAGLLHDLGKVVVERYLPERFKEVLEIAQAERMLIHEAEQKVLGATHEEIGSYLAEWWNMPSFLVNVIRWHHTPQMCNTDRDLLSAVHVADALAQQFALGGSGNFRSPDVAPACWSRFDLTAERVAALKERVEGILP